MSFIRIAEVSYLYPTRLTARVTSCPSIFCCSNVASAGGAAGTLPSNIVTIDDVSVSIPAQACPSDVTVRIAPIRNPREFTTESLCAYDFGPSGLVFTQQATITIPYHVRNNCKVRACWYDSTTGAFSDRGITEVQDIAVGSGLRALQFKTTHFTPFYLVTEDNRDAGGSGGGGCSLTVHDGQNPAAYFAPYLVIVPVMLLWRHKDKGRRATHV